MPRKPSVLAVGNINIDLTFYLEKKLEPDSEVFARDFSSFNGGSASNFAVGVSRLGLRSGMVGCVGDDRFGEDAIEALCREGVSTDHVKVLERKRTGTVCVLVEPGGGRTMVAYRGANGRLAEAVAGIGGGLPDVVQISNVGREVLRAVLERAGDSHGETIVSLDPGGSSGELSVRDLRGLDLLLLNEKECRSITRRGAEQGGRVLGAVVGIVVVKMGGDGCLLISDGRISKIPAYRVEVTDTTGAGDAFDAGFIAGIASGRAPEEAARWGSAAAAMKIQRKGAWAGLPTKSRLIGFLGGGI